MIFQPWYLLNQSNTAIHWCRSPAMCYWGTATSTSKCLIFGVTLELHKLDIRLHAVAYPVKQIYRSIALSIATVYCMNFVILCACHP